MEQISIFKGTQEIVKTIFNKQSEVTQLQKTIDEEKEKLRKILISSSDFSEEEKRFLGLNVVFSIDSVLDSIINKIVVTEKEIYIRSFTIEIGSNEINHNGFAFDTGRRELRAIVDSIAAKFQSTVTNHEFDPGGDYTYRFNLQPINS